MTFPIEVPPDSCNCTKDRRINKCPIVADAASIRTDAGSVGHDSYFCASPKNPGADTARLT